MRYITGNNTYYIAGIAGNYAVKSCGNNHIVVRFATFQEAYKFIFGRP